MMNLRSWTAALVCLAAVAGCDSQSPDDGPEKLCSDEPIAGVLQPLDPGNWWVYEERNSQGVRDSLRHEVTGTISDPSIPGGVGHIVRRSLVSNPDVYDERIWTNTEAGHSMVGVISGADTVLVDFVTYPYPASKGESFYAYSWYTAVGGGTEPFISDSTRYEVVSTDERLVTGAGTFSTTVFKYFLQPGAQIGEFYFQHYLPGVGFVGQDRYGISDENRDGEPRLTQRLVELCIQ